MHIFRSFSVLLLLAAALLAGAAGCSSAARAPFSPEDEAEDLSVSRETAEASARQDAYYRYGELAGGGVDVQRLGGFWIIELRSAHGGGLRYAISADDGSIRERTTFQ